jgi:hypothetical protein
MAKPRGATSYRLSEDAQGMLAGLATRLGLSKTAVLEMAIRKLARSELGEGDGLLVMTAAAVNHIAPTALPQQSRN